MEHRLRLHARHRPRNRPLLFSSRMFVIYSLPIKYLRELQIDESHSSGTIRVAAPISLSYYGCKNSIAGCSVKLKPGFFLSNEPGYYKEDDFGVRLENILEVVPADKLVHLDDTLMTAYN